MPESEIKKGHPRELNQLSIINVLTGYVPAGLLGVETKPIKDRAIDVGYRTRRPLLARTVGL